MTWFGVAIQSGKQPKERRNPFRRPNQRGAAAKLLALICNGLQNTSLAAEQGLEALREVSRQRARRVIAAAINNRTERRESSLSRMWDSPASGGSAGGAGNDLQNPVGSCAEPAHRGALGLAGNTSSPSERFHVGPTAGSCHSTKPRATRDPFSLASYLKHSPRHTHRSSFRSRRPETLNQKPPARKTPSMIIIPPVPYAKPALRDL